MLLQPRLQHFPSLHRRLQYKYDSTYQYSAYRQEIREDCEYRCVYCDAHEEEIGGELMFHLDHFRPQKHFPNLVHVPANLVWACCRCNLLKRDHWPALGLSIQETIKDGIGFIDPFGVDRNVYLALQVDGKLQALKPPGQYLIEKLALNRPFLRLNRQKREFVCKTLSDLSIREGNIKAEKMQFEQLLQKLQTKECEDMEICQNLIDAYKKILKMADEALQIIDICRNTIITIF